jgi:hypothetical protein
MRATYYDAQDPPSGGALDTFFQTERTSLLAGLVVVLVGVGWACSRRGGSRVDVGRMFVLVVVARDVQKLEGRARVASV